MPSLAEFFITGGFIGAFLGWLGKFVRFFFWASAKRRSAPRESTCLLIALAAFGLRCRPQCHRGGTTMIG
jgi:hypothetical protein